MRRSRQHLSTKQPSLFDDPDLYRKTAPCVPQLREVVSAWRKDQYPGVTAITRQLLDWWFSKTHLLTNGQVFQYYRAQREAIETLIYVYEVAKVRTSGDLLQTFAPLSLEKSLTENDLIPRYCIKMATGSGKTMVMALTIVWHYCNALLSESPNDYAHNFLLLAPNVIVLERLKNDFVGGRIFQTNLILPDDIRQDVWNLECVMRGETRSRRPGGTLFLTNIQQLYQHTKKRDIDIPAPFAEIFDVKTSKHTFKEKFFDYISQQQQGILVINDEAHHAYYEEESEWRKAIHQVAISTPLFSQVDFSATPRSKRGTLFPWIISDYPLRQAILDRVVKRPYRGIVDFKEDTTSPYASQRYKGFLVVAIERWREYRGLLANDKRHPILFIMLSNTEEADEVGHYLRTNYPEEFGESKTLVIHTGNDGEIKERDLEKARNHVREVDDPKSEINAIVSVLLLREGWDVQNVTVVVGLRAFTSRSQILPEQTIGRGMRLMFDKQQSDYVERVDITGNPKFLEFLDDLEEYEDIPLDTFKMGKEKINVYNIEPITERIAYDIAIPRIRAIIQRKQSLGVIIKELDIHGYSFPPLPKKTNQQTAQHVRYDILDYVTDEKTDERDFLLYDWKTANEAIGNYARLIAKELRFPTQFAKVVPKVREFLKRKAFGELVDLNDPLILQTIGRKYAIEQVKRFFVEVLGKQLIEEVEPILYNDPLKLSLVAKVISSNHYMFEPKKCILSYAPCSNAFEYDFARLLDQDEDILAWCKLDERFNFTIEYLDEQYNIHMYHPDFVANSADGTYWVIETKGAEDQRVRRKDDAARRWCSNASKLTGNVWYYMKVPYKLFYEIRPDFYDLRVLQQQNEGTSQLGT